MASETWLPASLAALNVGAEAGAEEDDGAAEDRARHRPEGEGVLLEAVEQVHAEEAGADGAVCGVRPSRIT